MVAGQFPRTQTAHAAQPDALLRIDVDLAEAVFGVEREITVDTAVGCPDVPRAGTAEGAQLTTCPMCRGRGEVQNVQRTFLGQVMTARACPQCQGYGNLNPAPAPSAQGTAASAPGRRSRSTSRPGGDRHRLLLSGQVRWAGQRSGR